MPPKHLCSPVHGEIVVDAMHQEVNHQCIGVVGEKSVNVEQEPVEDVLEDGPHEVAEEERRHSVEEGFRDDAAS